MPTNINTAMTFPSYMSQHMTTINSVTLLLLVNKLAEIQWSNYFSSSSLCSPSKLFWTECTREKYFASLEEKHTEIHTHFLLEQYMKLHVYSSDGTVSSIKLPCV